MTLPLAGTLIGQYNLILSYLKLFKPVSGAPLPLESFSLMGLTIKPSVLLVK